jgi:hypothetical protein
VPDTEPQWILETRRAVDRASDAVRAQQELKALTSAVNEFDTILDELANMHQAGQLGRGRWWHGIDIPPGLWAGLDSARRNLEGRELTPTIKDLRNFVKSARRRFEQAWQDHVNAQTARATQLREVVDVLSDSGHVAGLARELNRLRGLRQPDAGAVRILDDVVARYEAFESALPPAVKTFVAAAGRGGASINMINAEVRAWLTENGALDNFKVVAGSPAGSAHG